MNKQNLTKQELEQEYTKTKRKQELLPSQEIREYNDKTIGIGQNDDEFFKKEEDSDEENIEVLNLIQKEQQINSKYNASINVTKSRVRFLQIILVVLTSLAMLYCFYNASQLRKLVLFNGTRIFPKQAETLFDYKPSGSKIFYGSQIFSLYFYLIAIVLYSFKMLIVFIPMKWYPLQDEEQSTNQVITQDLRQVVVRIFQVYTFIFALGVYSQLYYFHYRKSLQRISIQSGESNISISFTWELVYGFLIFGMQTLKILWNLAIIFFSLRLKQYILRYRREYEKLKQYR